MKKKIHHKVLIVLVAAISISFTGCSGEKVREQGRYYDEETGFSIVFPADWEVRKGDGINASLVEGVSPWEDDEDIFSEYVGVDVEEQEEKVSLEDMFEAMLGVQADEFEYFSEVERGDMKIGGVEAKYLVFDIGMEEGRNRVKSYTLVKGRKGYLISCVAEEGKFDRYLDLFEETAASFRFE